MRLLQLKDEGGRFVAVRDNAGGMYRLNGYESVYALAKKAADGEESLLALVQNALGDVVDERQFFFADGRCNGVLPPIDHPDPAHMMISGTGLTHLGSAQMRDDMHAKEDTNDSLQTDSMRMFQLGVEGGKPLPTQFFGAQPEWFYKGDGNSVVPPGGDILYPHYATDGGEEPELTGVYIINKYGTPCRIGFALGNEYSDHVMEKKNYLWLAHSKLRQCALGAELLLGELPESVGGTSAVRRQGEIIWKKPFHSGEEHMCHSIANLERHHFKYDGFCLPGNLHVHFFGTATLSFSDSLLLQDGDEFVIESPVFGQPLCNRLRVQQAPAYHDIKVL